MNKNTGFTLIEVLIAMLVMAVGLLGLAGMQAKSLGNNQSAYNRSLATQLAYDLTDRMRANVKGLATYTTIAPAAATAKTQCEPTTTTGAACTPANMAENDLYVWNKAIADNLSSGTGSIPAPTAGVYTIEIKWDDDRIGKTASYLSFKTSFRL